MSDNPFHRLNSGPSARAAERAIRTRQFEQERVKWLMRKLGLQQDIHALREEAKLKYSDASLRFDVFNDRFAWFPFRIGVNVLAGMTVSGGANNPVVLPDNYAVHSDPRSLEPARFKNFSRVPFVAAFGEFYASVAGTAAGRNIALVFPRKGFLNGMVIHNDDSELYWTEGLCWVYKARTTDGGERRLYVQPFQQLVDAIVDENTNRPT